MRSPLAVTALESALRKASMVAMTRPALVAVTLFALAACNSSADQADPGSVTQDEAQALEDAASMLDEQRMTEDQAAPATNEEPTE